MLLSPPLADDNPMTDDNPTPALPAPILLAIGRAWLHEVVQILGNRVEEAKKHLHEAGSGEREQAQEALTKALELDGIFRLGVTDSVCTALRIAEGQPASWVKTLLERIDKLEANQKATMDRNAKLEANLRAATERIAQLEKLVDKNLRTMAKAIADSRRQVAQ